MITPSLAMIPQAYKSGKVYSQLPVSGGGDFDFTRAGSATRVDKDGFIEEVGANVPRLDYSNGGCPSLLLEPTRSNLIPYSNGFDNVAWEKGGGGTASAPIVSANQGISPDGTNNAFKVDFNLNGGTSANDRCRLTELFTGTTATNYTFSYWIKAFNSSDIGKVFNFNVDNVDNFGSIVVTENWQRVVFTGQSINSPINSHIQIRGSYGTSGSVSILLYGFQAEAGSYPTSYIPTQGSAVTRVADACNNGGNDQVINSTEGVLYAEISSENDSTNKQISINDGSSSNRISIILNASTNGVVASTHVGGSDTNLYVLTTNNVALFNKFAYKYKANDFSFWINGVKQTASISGGSVPSVNLSQLDFDIGNEVGSNPFRGNVKDVRVYNTALTDSELAALTKI